jgi:hypothetical protein
VPADHSTVQTVNFPEKLHFPSFLLDGNVAALAQAFGLHSGFW